MGGKSETVYAVDRLLLLELCLYKSNWITKEKKNELWNEQRNLSVHAYLN